MTDDCTVELFANGRWTPVASVSLLAPKERGWKTATLSGYDATWSADHAGAQDAWALCTAQPVGFEPVELPHWPVFLIDTLPQGYGRRELLRRLKLPETMEEPADWPLLLAGAANPIGHLRVQEAWNWLQEQKGTTRGFSDEEVAERSEKFIEFLSGHGLFVAGSSGVQGEWPKVLLTRGRDGLLYLDHTLADEDAREHYIVKFGRGANPDLARILRNEAPYMELARFVGLRVHASLRLLQRALFIPRFDRVVQDGGVVRLAQESIATLTGRVGMDFVPSHDEVCRKLSAVATDPLGEVLEYIKRDVANIALGNKDNHARNTAVQRRFDGYIGLTPLYDFAPMYVHPDGIARRIRWEGNDGGSPDWGKVLDKVSEECGLNRAALSDGLKAMVPCLKELVAFGKDVGVDSDVMNFLTLHIQAQAKAIEQL
ncbi:MAG: type II toxin-antitoxin system HipA family toxin [Ramlibacter sp.]